MTLKKKSYSDMVSDAVRYLTANTDITYLDEGSIARSLIEATALQISRHQDFVEYSLNSAYLSTASGMNLDLIGDMLGVPRRTPSVAQVSAEDGVVRFYVNTGTLSAVLPASGSTQVYVPQGTLITNADNTIVFAVTLDTYAPKNSRSVFVPVIAQGSGSTFNVGSNQLTRHNLNSQPTLKVTNDVGINTGSDYESDENYRYRLAKFWTSRYGSNRAAVQIAAISDAGVANATVLEYARGAGTFDVLLIPRGNKVTQATKDNVRQAIDQVSSFGISSQIREPIYIPFKVTVELTFDSSVDEGQRSSIRDQAQSAILDYFSDIPLGGSFNVTRLRASVISLSSSIVDFKIHELCFDKRPRAITGFSLREDELFVPDNESGNPVKVN